MPPLFCFIDDTQFELDVFTQSIIPAAKGIDFILGSSAEEVLEKVGDRMPCLFLLDLYGKDPALAPKGLPTESEMTAKARALGSMSEIFNNIDQADDQVNEYLRRLYRLSDGWRRFFHQAARDAGQSTAFGLGNLVKVREKFPYSAALAYTRKSLIIDAVDVLVAGMDGVFLKPHAQTDAATYDLTREKAPELLAQWSEFVSRRFTNEKNKAAMRLLQNGLPDDALKMDAPDALSDKAQELLGNGGAQFLHTAGDWEEYRSK